MFKKIMIFGLFTFVTSAYLFSSGVDNSTIGEGAKASSNQSLVKRTVPVIAPGAPAAMSFASEGSEDNRWELPIDDPNQIINEAIWVCIPNTTSNNGYSRFSEKSNRSFGSRKTENEEHYERAKKEQEERHIAWRQIALDRVWCDEENERAIFQDQHKQAMIHLAEREKEIREQKMSQKVKPQSLMDSCLIQ